MRSRINTITFIYGLYILLDIYTFFGLKSLFRTKTSKLIFSIAYILCSIYIYYCMYSVYQALFGGGFFGKAQANFQLGIVVTALIGKLAFCVFMLPQDIGILLIGIGRFVRDLFTGRDNNSGKKYFPSRRRFLTLITTGLAAIPFGTMLYGVTKGKYAYTINKVKLAFKDLPASFEGFKIVQISDIHAGSLDDKEEVAKGVRMINEQQPDVIVFTGDLVNSDKNEVDPYINVFKELTAPFGKFSVLGNHDYYGVPDEQGREAERNYWADFYKKYEAMGFQLLNNENVFIEKNEERIGILGVENWGRGRWFPKRGDLDKALNNTTKEEFCVLLSHDPTHWDDKVLPHNKKIHLTLSGHTHGFQFGINMPGFKWSPAQYRYDRWIGLYEEAEQYLYVNKGFGFLAFPGRVGMWPEITVIELAKEV